MKKKISALIMAILLVFSIPMAALAASGFNKAVFYGRDELKITNKNDGTTSIVVKSTDTSNSMIPVNGAIFTVTPEVVSDDSFQTYYIHITYIGTDWENATGFSFIMDGKTYKFETMIGEKYRTKAVGNVKSLCVEKQTYVANWDTIQLMTDFAANFMDKDIKVRVDGDRQYEFSLTDEQKNNIVHLFNLYVAADGTRDSNMDKITNLLNFKLITMEITK